ncbi:MAG: histidine kinase [Microbacterium sp.]|uniref:sensor histidine kinase n=1 Tax=Microbacterium sp. TaxID=51671 RepID=UPI00261F4F2C|nr:histidine kinase [Microbacterium sp.]MCX6501745.1 histidine kinase [Microbacterium sp.]
MHSAPSPSAAPVAGPPRGRPPGWARDLLASIVVLATTLGPLARAGVEPPVWGSAIAVLPAGLMFLRRRLPWVVLVACVACFGAAAFSLVLTPFSALPTGIAVFTIASRYPRRTVLLTVPSVIVVMLPFGLVQEWSTLYPLTALIVLTVGFFGAAGDAVRSRRAFIAGLTQRALDAEQAREAEASRRVAEDRLRIARDLHDAVAHQISVVSLNAGVASRALEDDPDTAREALATVRTAARRVLSEIGDLMSSLRAEDDGAARAPVPSLTRVAALTDDFEASGLRVTSRVDADVSALPAAVDVTAYRVIQEALTNAQKHGSDSRAHVLIERDAAGLRIVVSNPAATVPVTDATPGRGILGMRERVAAVGGTLQASREGGTFRVDALLPISGAAT